MTGIGRNRKKKKKKRKERKELKQVGTKRNGQESCGSERRGK